MALRSMLRLLGLSSFLGGLMVGLVQPWFYYDPGSFIASYIDYIGYILILLGIIGLYLAQFKETGSYGLLIFLFVLISHTLWLGYKWFLTFVHADLMRSAPNLTPADLPATNYGADLSLYALLIGFAIFSLVSLWKGIVSRIGSSLLFLGALGALAELIMEFIPFHLLIPHSVIGLSFAWLGWSLFYGKEKLPNSVPNTDENMEQIVEEQDHNEVTEENTVIEEENKDLIEQQKEEVNTTPEHPPIQEKENLGSS